MKRKTAVLLAHADALCTALDERTELVIAHLGKEAPDLTEVDQRIEFMAEQVERDLV